MAQRRGGSCGGHAAKPQYCRVEAGFGGSCSQALYITEPRDRPVRWCCQDGKREEQQDLALVRLCKLLGGQPYVIIDCSRRKPSEASLGLWEGANEASWRGHPTNHTGGLSGKEGVRNSGQPPPAFTPAMTSGPQYLCSSQTPPRASNISQESFGGPADRFAGREACSLQCLLRAACLKDPEEWSSGEWGSGGSSWTPSTR
jgi:hypothetical protein